MQRTKNLQSEQMLQLLVNKAFDGLRMESYSELTEGFCNAAYLITLENGNEVVLKIAPADIANLMSYEVNMMQAEVTAMHLVAANTQLLLPKVLYYDSSKTVCDSAYFFMERTEGQSFWASKKAMGEEDVHAVETEIGVFIRVLHGIKGPKFGLLGNMETSFKAFYPFFEKLMLGVLQDGRNKNIDIGVDYESVHASLIRDQSNFHEVTIPSLVHWDTWEGNWLIKDHKVTGLIDWERALFGDPLMEERFRSHSMNENFKKGYGAYNFSDSEKVRLAWYDSYLYLIMMIEGAYRGYENDDQYNWAKHMFLPIMEKLIVGQFN